MNFTEIGYFLLAYSEKLQVIHQIILNFIIAHLPKFGTALSSSQNATFSAVDYVKMIHVLFLNGLHFYLIYALWNKINAGVTVLKAFQFIALVISFFDWLFMDLFMVCDTTVLHCWYRLVALTLLPLHVLPVIYYVRALPKQRMVLILPQYNMEELKK